MKIGVLTSSRADFGIYLPLLKAMQNDNFFQVEIIAFGTHVSHFHGYTITHIESEGLSIPYKIESLILGDSEEAIATAMAVTSMKFSSFWASHRNDFDIVLCLGDRYEMYAAVLAGVPFGIRFGHFHGGEKTLGAIDNIFRHAISLCSKLHFVAADEYAERVKNIVGGSDNVYTVGALSLDNLSTLPLLSQQEFYDQWHIDLTKPSILVTLHPETIAITKNQEYAQNLANVLNSLKEYQVIVTMPNSDSSGMVIRKVWEDVLSHESRIFRIENFGTKSYFTCLKYCSFLLGNTSSGVIEAASFGKYVINVGRRQEGRAKGGNVIDSDFEVESIKNIVKRIESSPAPSSQNIYWKGGAVDRILKILKEQH